MKDKQPTNDIMIAKIFSSDINKDTYNSTIFFIKSKIAAFFILTIIWLAGFVSIKLYYKFNVYISLGFAIFLIFPIYNIFAFFYTLISVKKSAEYPINKGNKGQYFFYRDRFIYSDNTTTSVINYKHIIKAFETKLYFFIFVAKDKIYAVPKTGFMFPDEKEVLSRFLAVKLDKKFKKK